MPGVLDDVARERDGEVVVEGESALRGGRLVGLQSRDRVDLLVDLALAQEVLDGLDRARLDTGEAVQLERPLQHPEDVELDQAFLRKPFGEAGQ